MNRSREGEFSLTLYLRLFGIHLIETEIDGELRDPLRRYLESLSARRQIVEEFGESPASLRDVFVSLSCMISMTAKQPNNEAASDHAAEAETILNTMAERGWTSPQWQQVKEWLTAKQAELERDEQDK